MNNITAQQKLVINQVQGKVDTALHLNRRINGYYTDMEVGRAESEGPENIVIHHREGKQEGEKDDWVLEVWLVVRPDGQWQILPAEEWYPADRPIFKSTPALCSGCGETKPIHDLGLCLECFKREFRPIN